jgi:amino acid transporter
LGVGAVGFASFNTIVGAGIFGLPGPVAALLGPAAVLGYLVCALLVSMVGLCLAECGSRVSSAGGTYAYAGAAFGPVVAGIVGTMTWLTNIAGSAAVANLWVDTLAAGWPAAALPGVRIGLIVAAYLLLALLNVRGARQGARASTVFAAAKLVPLMGVATLGLFAIHPANLRWSGGAPSAASLGEAAVLLFFAFSGVETGLTASGEVRDPARTVPRALLLACALIATLYIAIQLVAQGMLGAALPRASAPLIDIASMLMGSWGARLMLLAIVLSTSGYLVADLLCSPRALFALAERRQLPHALAAVHARYATPYRAVWTHAVLCALLAVSGSFRALAVFTSSTVLVVYLVCSLGVLRLRTLRTEQCGTPFIAPGGALVPLLTAGLVGFLFTGLSRLELLATLGPVVLSGVVYAVLERRHARAIKLKCASVAPAPEAPIP